MIRNLMAFMATGVTFALVAAENPPVAKDFEVAESLAKSVNSTAVGILKKHGKPMAISDLQNQTVHALKVSDKDRTLSDTVKALLYSLINRSEEQAKKDSKIYGATVIRAQVGLAGVLE